MLTPEQIAALRDRAGQITDPINDFMLKDIARRIAEAGQLTSTASYQVWRMQQMGVSQSEIKKRLKKLLKKSSEEVEQLLTQSAEVGYRYDLERLPTAAGIPFEQNSTIQQIVSSTVELALEDFTNLTQTIGMVDPHGNALPLQDVYRSCTDYAFKQVITGATDYNTAVRRATKNLVDYGVRVIDYESGVHTSVEAAVRRNIMGGLGLMQEKINAVTHEDFGCDGWEISAHANSAPDHEPIQGKQYTDAAYESLNNSLVRRIGTLNCGHAAFPIIMGVSPPQYTKEELEKFREDNEKGVTFEGKHYTGYEATQFQRKLERTIRKQKKRVFVDEATGDEEKLLIDRIKLQRLRQEYNRFSKAAGLRTQNERLFVAGFGKGKAVTPSPKPKAPVVEKKPASGATPKAPIVPPVKQAQPTGTDVLAEYIKNATPGVGTITYEDGYEVKHHANEIKTAQWLHGVFGGDIVLLKESDVDGVKRPDYLWRGKLWDLKNTTTAKAADSAVRHGLKQIRENPGGIILDYGENDIVIKDVVELVNRRVLRGQHPPVDVMFVSNGKAVKIIRYKK